MLILFLRMRIFKKKQARLNTITVLPLFIGEKQRDSSDNPYIAQALDRLLRQMYHLVKWINDISPEITLQCQVVLYRDFWKNALPVELY